MTDANSIESNSARLADVVVSGSPWAPGGVKVREAMRGLTKAERRHVANGCISGDFQMRTVTSLQRKGMFYLKITSPNGRAGVMELTPLGLNVRALLADHQPTGA